MKKRLGLIAVVLVGSLGMAAPALAQYGGDDQARLGQRHDPRARAEPAGRRLLLRFELGGGHRHPLDTAAAWASSRRTPAVGYRPPW